MATVGAVVLTADDSRVAPKLLACCEAQWPTTATSMFTKWTG